MSTRTPIQRETPSATGLTRSATSPEPEPKPQTEPEPKPNLQQVGNGTAGRLVALCVAHDLHTRPPKEPAGEKLRTKLADEYAHLVAWAIENYPTVQDDDLVTLCVGKRRGEPVSTALSQTLQPINPHCPNCNGHGVTYEQSIDNEGIPRLRPVPCKCQPNNQPPGDTK